VTAPPSNATAPTIVAVGGTVSVTNLGTCDGAPQPWVEGVRWEVDGEPISETSFRLTDRVEGEEIQMFQTWRGIAGGSVEVGSNIVTVGAASDHVTFDSTVVTFDSTLRTFDEAA
jgi:hypothetical protein